MLLRQSPDKGNATYPMVLDLAEQGTKRDPRGYRREFVELVKKAEALSRQDHSTVRTNPTPGP
jgi:Ca-activated chloride channel family protein